MANTEQVAQIAIQNTSHLICTYWRPQERTILIEYVDEHEDGGEASITWFEIPDTAIVGDTLSEILKSDLYWNSDLCVFGDVDMTHPMCHEDTYFNNRWADYAEKRIAFQSSVSLLPVIG